MVEVIRETEAVPDALLTFGLASFHAALFVAVVVGALYGLGVAGSQLAALDTSVGVAAYAYLWGVTWWSTRRWLTGAGDGLRAGDVNQRAFFAGAIMWGGATGLLVFVPTFVVGGALFVGAGGLAALPFLLFGAAVGAALAAGVGALAGSLLALVDLAAARTAHAWLGEVDAATE